MFDGLESSAGGTITVDTGGTFSVSAPSNYIITTGRNGAHDPPSDVIIGGGDGSVFLHDNVMIPNGPDDSDWQALTERFAQQQERIDDQQALIGQLTERLEAVELYVDRRAQLAGERVADMLGRSSEVLRPEPYTVTMPSMNWREISSDGEAMGATGATGPAPETLPGRPDGPVADFSISADGTVESVSISGGALSRDEQEAIAMAVNMGRMTVAG